MSEAINTEGQPQSLKQPEKNWWRRLLNSFREAGLEAQQRVLEEKAARQREHFELLQQNIRSGKTIPEDRPLIEDAQKGIAQTQAELLKVNQALGKEPALTSQPAQTTEIPQTPGTMKETALSTGTGGISESPPSVSTPTSQEPVLVGSRRR